MPGSGRPSILAHSRISCAQFCTRHMQHTKPFVYGPSVNDAKLTLCGMLGAFPDSDDWAYDSGVRRLGLSLRRLLRVIERMYRLNLSIYDVNPVKNVIRSIHSLHVEDGGNVISLDYVLL